MLQVEIKDPSVRVQSGTSSRTQKPFQIRKQTAYINTGKAYPEEFVITLQDDQQPYPAGTYVINDARSVFVDRRYGELKFGRLELIPAKS